MTSELSKEEKEEISKINQLTQVSMARLWRSAPSGHPYFDKRKPYFKVFEKRFNELGGLTPENSKLIDCWKRDKMKAKIKRDPNRAKKRNFGKYCLSGMYSTLRNMCGKTNPYLVPPLLEEERTALISILKDIRAVLKNWDENYKKLKKEEQNET